MGPGAVCLCSGPPLLCRFGPTGVLRAPVCGLRPTPLVRGGWAGSSAFSAKLLTASSWGPGSVQCLGRFGRTVCGEAGWLWRTRAASLPPTDAVLRFGFVDDEDCPVKVVQLGKEDASGGGPLTLGSPSVPVAVVGEGRHHAVEPAGAASAWRAGDQAAANRVRHGLVCCAIAPAAACAPPFWRSATVRWAFGTPCARSSPETRQRPRRATEIGSVGGQRSPTSTARSTPGSSRAHRRRRSRRAPANERVSAAGPQPWAWS